MPGLIFKNSHLNSNEKRLEKIEKVIERLARRSRKITSAIITPIPVSNCVIGEDVKGIILRYMFTCPGMINKGGIFLSKKPDSGAMVVLSIENESGGNRKSYTISRKNMIFEPKLEVDTWDRLSIMLEVIDPEKDKITEAWISFLWTPTIKDVTVKNHLIDALDGGLSNLLEEE